MKYSNSQNKTRKAQETSSTEVIDTNEIELNYRINGKTNTKTYIRQMVEAKRTKEEREFCLVCLGQKRQQVITNLLLRIFYRCFATIYFLQSNISKFLLLLYFSLFSPSCVHERKKNAFI